MKIVEQNKWAPCDGIVLEESANFVARSQEDILVVAGPGAGKTELLAQKASYLFQTNTCNEPQKILAISFKKDAAENLKKRVVKRCGNEVESRFISMTFDAFSKSILDHFPFALPESLRPDQTYLVGDDEIINAAFQKAGFTNPYNLSSSKLKKYYDSILSAVQLPFSKDGLGERVWKYLLKGFDGHNATLSFKMISILAEYIIRSNPKIKRSLQITYKYVFLDEFQDTTDLQYELVKQCFLGSNSIITAVGDNKQRIMVWAGARKTIFKDFEKDFKAKTKKLIMNHRSAPRLVDLQRKMYDSLNEKDNTIAVSEKWNPNDGDVSLLIAENEQQEATIIKRSISQYIGGIVCDEDNTDYIEVSKAKNASLPTEEVIKLLEKLIADDKKAEQDITIQKEKLQKELDEIKAKINKAQDVISAKADLDENEAAFAAETEAQKELTARFEEEKSNQPKIKVLGEKAAAIKALLPDYDEFETKEKTFKLNKTFIENSNEVANEKENEIKAVSDEIAKISEERKTLEKAGEEKLKLETEKKTLTDNADKLANLKENIVALEKAESDYSQALEDYNNKQSAFERLDGEYKALNKVYLDAQAGILADTLKLDEPCPVCGSTTHPKIAVKPENAPTKEQLEKLQGEVDAANNDANSARTKAGNLKGVLDEKKESVSSEIKALLGDGAIADAKSLILVKLSNIDAEIETIDKKISEAKAKIERAEEIDRILPEKNKELEALKEELSKLSDEIKSKTVENTSLEKRIGELKAKLTFATKEEAQEKIDEFTENAEQMGKDYDSALKALNDSKAKIASLKSAKEEIVKRLGDKTDIDLEEEKEKLADLEDRMESYDREAKITHARISANQSALDNIKARSGDLITTEKKYSWVKALSNTANGNIAGKEKVMLETYIQMNYFDRIIARANTRLMIMTDGQYDLVRRKEALSNKGQSGLDLNVIDHYNGSERSVKSLSGGESFKASLALALGLADEIQSSAGGIKLDTMFVDEGFGSLDEESLAAAMKALTSLADGNRLVGIISHVGELKQKIDKQIIVKKDKVGGSYAEIVV